MPLFMKFLHVITAFWFIAGLIGRTLTMWQATKVDDVRMVKLLVGLGGYFERWMVRPGSLAVLGFGLATAWLQNWPLLGTPAGLHVNWIWVSLALSLSMIPVIALVFIPRGKIFEAALSGALEQNQVTPELKASFRDRPVKLAHRYELIITVVIILLMVIKPF
jgi:hypothetical protein